MRKQIVNSVDECNQMQQFWLRQQNELVKNTKSSEEQQKALDSLEKQLLIMNQKKLRIDGMSLYEKIIALALALALGSQASSTLFFLIHRPVIP